MSAGAPTRAPEEALEGAPSTAAGMAEPLSSSAQISVEESDRAALQVDTAPAAVAETSQSLAPFQGATWSSPLHGLAPIVKGALLIGAYVLLCYYATLLMAGAP